jgi:exodeoxyribonuclease VII large subunit
LLEVKNKFQAARLSPVFAQFPRTVREIRGSVEDMRARSENLLRDRLLKADERLKLGMASLDALSPLAVLGRGYSITYKENGRVLRDASDAVVDEKIKVQLARGSVEARIKNVTEE